MKNIKVAVLALSALVTLSAFAMRKEDARDGCF